MKKLKVVLLCGLFFGVFSSYAYSINIQVLFNALKRQPISRINSLMVKQANIGYKRATDNFYPSIYGIAGWEHYNSPTSLRPMTPTESSEIAHSSGSYPFSKNITQIGVEVKFPILMFPLFEISKKALEMKKSAAERKKLEFIRNEASIVVLNAKLEYLENLKKALDAEKERLKKQLKILNVAVKNGRAAPVSVLKIESAISSIRIKVNSIETSKNQVLSAIYTLTGIKLTEPVKMQLVKKPKGGEFLPIKPLQYQLEAKRYAIRAKESELLPKVYLSGKVFRKFGRSYNTNDPVVRNYGSIGVFVSIPIFDKPLYTDIEMAKSDYLKTKFELEQVSLELASKSKELKKNLTILNSSIKLAYKDVKDKKRMLNYAEVAFRIGRMTEEDYLKYVSDFLNAKANLYELKMRRWEIISELAVIFGNDLKELVK
ncbi:TolC family protein [Hippea alviniae]|uniref:TolC family protein n=1 Tax=Hippea alviniae TaxID=1279027 RepID=UPI0003B56F48|nr:TolC family protein [Hippea alviniae]